METDNKTPELVIDAIIDNGKNDIKKEDCVVNVYPMTIRRYALLEKINSPFVVPTGAFNVETIIPSSYIMCTDNQKLRQYAAVDAKVLIEDAFDWSENLDVADLPKLITHLTNQLKEMNTAAPDAAPTSTKKN